MKTVYENRHVSSRHFRVQLSTRNKTTDKVITWRKKVFIFPLNWNKREKEIIYWNSNLTEISWRRMRVPFQKVARTTVSKASRLLTKARSRTLCPVLIYVMNMLSDRIWKTKRKRRFLTAASKRFLWTSFCMIHLMKKIVMVSRYDAQPLLV